MEIEIPDELNILISNMGNFIWSLVNMKSRHTTFLLANIMLFCFSHCNSQVETISEYGVNKVVVTYESEGTSMYGELWLPEKIRHQPSQARHFSRKFEGKTKTGRMEHEFPRKAPI